MAPYFSVLKYAIPRKRVIADDEVADLLNTSVVPEVFDSASVGKGSNESPYVEKTHTKEEPVTLEYRDEKDRKWWKFFDEYEYRQNKQSRSQHKWFKWFNEDDTPKERVLLTKIDILLTFYSLMAYWVKYLDQTNLTNAYIGGLEEGIGMVKNDLVNTQVMFNIGNIVFQIPFMYVLYALPLNYVLPSLDLCWSILTICLYRVTSVWQLKALRFFIGAFEAPSYLAYQYLFGSWYKADEISRRSMIYYFGQYLGLLTSGLLSGAIERNLNGKNGLDAWQWIFIIDGIISIVVGFIGFYVLPGTPTDCYSFFLTDDEIKLARKRLQHNRTAARPAEHLLKSLFSYDMWKSILTSWEIYVLTFWNIFCWNNNNGTSGAYALWLKSLGRYGAGKLQDMTAMTPGLGLVWLFVTCMYADLFHSRWQAIVFSQCFNVTGNAILAAWHVPERAKWFAWCLQYFGWAMAPVLYSWQNDICRENAQKRAVILVVMNMLAQTTVAWTSVLVWKTVEAPRYLKGYTYTACCAFMLIVWTFLVLYLYKRNERKNARKNGIILYNSSIDKDIPHIDEEDPSDLNSVSASNQTSLKP